MRSNVVKCGRMLYNLCVIQAQEDRIHGKILPQIMLYAVRLRYICNLRAPDFIGVLDSENHEPRKGVNMSFISKKNEIYTYKQERIGLAYLYYKRKVCADGKRTMPTDL